MIKSSGFTLLEVMIALMIMAVLSLITAQAMRSGVNNKAMVSREISRDARLADTLRIMRADIAAAFHYQDIFCKLDNEAMQAPAQQAAQGQVPGNPPPIIPPAQPLNNGLKPGATPKPCPPEVTGFIGSSDSLYFTSLSNLRTIRDSQEGDQAKIAYFVKGCQVFGAAKENQSKCLYRAISPFLDEDIDKPGAETLLVENVEEFKLRYLGPEHEDYVDTWKTGQKGGDDTTRDKFPYAVEITLTLLDKNNPKDRPATQTILAPIAFENNIKKKTAAEQQADANGQGNQNGTQTGTKPQTGPPKQ